MDMWTINWMLIASTISNTIAHLRMNYMCGLYLWIFTFTGEVLVPSFLESSTSVPSTVNLPVHFIDSSTFFIYHRSEWINVSCS